MIIKVRCDLAVDGYTTKLYITAGNSLGKCNEVWFYVKIFKCEHLSGTSPSCHNFITDHENSKFITNLTHTRQITLRRNNNSIRSCDCLHHNRCHLIRSFINNLLTQLCQIILCCFFLRCKVNRLTIDIWVKELYKSRNSRFKRITSRLTR